MKKEQKQAVINKMKEIVGYIRDREKNADAFCSAETILHNMNNYFSGLSFALEVTTGKDYTWSNGEDGNAWAIIESPNCKDEKRYYLN